MKALKIPVGISSCLLGENVRFDGGHKLHSYIEQTLGQYFEFRPFCPELAIGLGVPRKPIRLVRHPGSDTVHCVGVTEPERDFTAALTNIAHEQLPWQQELCGYILKKGSPSCGMERVKVYTSRMPSTDGAGIYAATMMANLPHLPVEEEGRLGDSRLRENFIQRVYVTYRWRQLLAEGLSVGGLVDFHARHKLIIMSRDQRANRELGQLVAATTRGNLGDNAEIYHGRLMTTLKKVATPRNHVNVLQHIQGYLKKQLDKDDKAELVQCIENYRQGLVPLIVPITLLNHHFRRNPDDYIARSWYMQPYPAELSLTNTL
ncbi:MAG: hypothetical protein RLZZ385_2195 [Pseudomonadota bacterium]